jgi:hypothetical protein
MKRKSGLFRAGYRSASRPHDQRLDRHHDFSNKAGVAHSEVVLPDDAAERRSNRETRGSIVSIADAVSNATTIYSYDEHGIPGRNQTGRFHYTGQAWIPELSRYLTRLASTRW